jgi:hypothetical protein
MPLSPRLAVVAVIAAFGAVPAVAAAVHTPDPETDKSLGPGDGAGHYFGGQSSTSSFHGCTKSDDQWFPLSVQSGQPTLAKSTHRYVTFKVNRNSYPTFSWKAKSGYRICGVEAFVLLSSNQTKGGQYLTYASYTSGAVSGSTDPKGKETIKVRTPKNLGEDQEDLKIFAGKTLGMDGFQAVTVYVKRG